MFVPTVSTEWESGCSGYSGGGCERAAAHVLGLSTPLAGAACHFQLVRTHTAVQHTARQWGFFVYVEGHVFQMARILMSTKLNNETKLLFGLSCHPKFRTGQSGCHLFKYCLTCYNSLALYSIVYKLSVSFYMIFIWFWSIKYDKLSLQVWFFSARTASAVEDCTGFSSLSIKGRRHWSNSGAAC